jgi:hypothetical protein
MKKISIKSVIETAQKAEPQLMTLVEGVISKLSGSKKLVKK